MTKPPPGGFVFGRPSSTTGTDRRVLAFFDKRECLETAAMGFLFYLTLFIVMCVFGWSARGAG